VRARASTGRVPGPLQEEHRRYFANLLEAHSRATIEVDPNGIRCVVDAVLGKSSLDRLCRGAEGPASADIFARNEIARLARAERFHLRCLWFVTDSGGMTAFFSFPHTGWQRLR